MVELPLWLHRAACRGVDPETFFPSAWNEKALRPVREICGACPVTSECLAYAIEGNLTFGIYGGMTPSARKTYRRDNELAARRGRRHFRPCGHPSAYRRHIRRGETPCDACLQAERLRNNTVKRKAAKSRTDGQEAMTA